MRKIFLPLSLIASGLACSGLVHAEALIGPQLSQSLTSQTGPFNVIVSMNEQQQVDSVLQSLNVPYQTLKTLPMAGPS
ncbi:hypothetical protein [Salinimonas marina]|uniref:hypothetical protein n=1 Tax=Salinimonas marina TaxID=2785918 RepID=UPI001C550093|nr:hypothetical protein [Salinimonas marina]